VRLQTKINCTGLADEAPLLSEAALNSGTDFLEKRTGYLLNIEKVDELHHEARSE